MEFRYEFRLREQQLEQSVHRQGQNCVHNLTALVRRCALRAGHKSGEIERFNLFIVERTDSLLLTAHCSPRNQKNLRHLWDRPHPFSRLTPHRVVVDFCHVYALCPRHDWTLRQLDLQCF